MLYFTFIPNICGIEYPMQMIVNEASGDPRFDIKGSVLARANDLGVESVHVSLSHDAGIASAVVVLE